MGTIVQVIMEYWVRIFGSPGSFLSDNGGEFVNKELMEYAEKFNITLRTTGAESAWSNGLCEKHNETLANLTMKIMNDTKLQSSFKKEERKWIIRKMIT